MSFSRVFIPNRNSVAALVFRKIDSNRTRQVIRYSALFTGLVYGIYHQSSIRTHEKVAKLEHEYHHKEALIEQARAEYARKTAPPASISIGGMLPPHLFAFYAAGLKMNSSPSNSLEQSSRIPTTSGLILRNSC